MHIIQLSNPACLCNRVAIELAELVSGVSELVQLILGVRALGAHVIGELLELMSVSRALGARICRSFQSSRLSISCQSSNLSMTAELSELISVGELSKLESIGELWWLRGCLSFASSHSTIQISNMHNQRRREN